VPRSCPGDGGGVEREGWCVAAGNASVRDRGYQRRLEARKHTGVLAGLAMGKEIPP
jgi:hypothetical protein